MKSVDISGDGRYVVAGGNNFSISLFTLGNSTPTWTYPTQTAVYVVRISDDGSTIVAESYDGYTYLIDRATGSLIWKASVTHSTSYPWDSVGISGDGNYVVITALEEDHIYLLGKSSNVPLWNYTNPAGYTFSSIAISRDGNYVAAGNMVGDVYLFRKESNVPIWSYWTRPPEGFLGGSSLAGHVNTVPILSVALSSNGSYIVASNEAPEIYLFKSSSDVPYWIYDTRHSSWVDHVTISADGGYVAAGGQNGWIYLLKVTDLTWINVGSLPQPVAASAVLGVAIMLAATSTIVIHNRVKMRHSQTRRRR